MIDLARLNALPVAEFTAALASIFEHSPWVPERAAAARPFRSRLQLLETLRSVVEQASIEDQMALIRAHPQLGTRGRTPLTQASAREQRRAGLDACNAEELAQLDALNAAYVAKFSMPFILAVRGHDPASIVVSMQRRLALEEVGERCTALGQIGLIAGFRLADTVTAPAGAEIMAMHGRLTRDQESGDSPTALERLREWMLAAALDVSTHADCLVGRRYGAGGGKRLLLGVHHDMAADRLNGDAPLSVLVALAALQELRARGTTLSFDVLLLAKTDDLALIRQGDVSLAAADDSRPAQPEHLAPTATRDLAATRPEHFSLAWYCDVDPDDARGCVAWSALSGGALNTPAARSVAAALRPSPLDDDCLVLARAGTTSIVPRPVTSGTTATLDRAVMALQDFLLQTEKPGGYNG